MTYFRDYTELFQNCVLYMPFNGDYSDYAKQQTVTGYNTPIFTTLSSGRKALTLNGSNQYLSIPDSSVMELGSNNFTISLWFLYSSTFDSAQALISKRINNDYTSPLVLIFGGNTAPNLYLYISINGNSWFISNGVVLSRSILNISTWYNLTFLRDSGSLYGYLNGTLTYYDTTISTNSLYDGTNPWLIGAGYASNQIFSGMMKNLIILNGTALNQAQIKQLMDLTHPLNNPIEFFPIINGVRGCY